MTNPTFKVQFSHASPANWIINFKPFKPSLTTNYKTELKPWVKSTFVDPMFESDDGVHPAVLNDVTTGKPSRLTQDDLVNALLEDNFNINQDNDDQTQLTEVFQRAAEYVDTSKLYSYQQQLSTDLIRSNKQSLPASNIRYTFNVDILPATRELLKDFNDADARTKFKYSWAGYFYSNPLQKQWNVTVFQNYKGQKAFQDYLAIYVQQHPSGNQIVDNKLIQASQAKPNTDFTTTWLLGDGKYDSNEVSVNKIMMHVLGEFLEAHPDNGFVVPTSVKQAMVPTSFSFVNLSNLSQMDRHDFMNELNTIASGINYLNKFDFASMKSLASADMVDKSLNKQHTPKKANNHTGDGQHDASARRSFSRKNLSVKNQIKMVKTIMKHCFSAMPSSNTYKTRHSTFMRGNRRRPDDINLPGQVTKTAYRPDIAIYLDTSGSISEEEYRNAVTLLIKLTQALNTNLYFTSFSHYVSQPVKLETKQCSAKQIYKQIQSLPKAGGGTNYENVWELIDMMSKYTKGKHQASQLNFIITDFEYDLSSSCVLNRKKDSMKNTYYLPMRESGASDQNYLVRCATSFAKEMAQAGFRDIYKHILL